MSRLYRIPLSVLDLAPIAEGSDAATALRQSRSLARDAERLGFNRFWLAEHHNMPGIASAATAVAIGYVAAATDRIRVGAGGIMLANHAPLMVAEQFGTLEALYPGRVDLGLGRAPGSDRPATRALRRGLNSTGDDFPQLLEELRGYLAPIAPGAAVTAVPGVGMDIPIWLLGSGDFSARLAARLGLPFAFAAHFSPDNLEPALDVYRREFRPSAALSESYAMVCVNVVAAETDAEARCLATSHQQAFLNLIRGRPGKLPAPVASMDGLWTAQEEAAVSSFARGSIVGGPHSVRERLERLADHSGADELMAHAMIFDPAARLRSYEIAADIRWGDSR